MTNKKPRIDMKPTVNGYIEIEVKFHIKDIKAARSGIIAAGAVSSGNDHEINTRYDDRDSTLFKSGQLLRLRKTEKNILTFKKPPAVKNPDFKMYEEMEVEVSDFNIMEKIIAELGFFRVQSYEKYRESFLLNDTHILVDRMPYGDFVEIEGDVESIKNCADAIGLDWNERITLNYLEIFERIAKRMNLDFRDITFENFKKTRESFVIEPSDYIS